MYYRYVLRGVELFDGYDEVHAYSGPMDFISSFVVYKTRGDKKVQWIHFDVSHFWFEVKTCRTLYRKMTEVRVVSKDALNSLVIKMPEMERKAIAVSNVISSVACRKMAENGPGFDDVFKGIRIVTLGRLSYTKGQDIIPEIAAELKTRGYHFCWYLIGDGELRGPIEDKVSKLRVDREVCLLGAKTNPYPFLKEADVYVQTSVHEGFCLALSEARAFNLPVISTECAGAHEQLDGLPDCSIVQRNPSELVKAIEEKINLIRNNSDW